MKILLSHRFYLIFLLLPSLLLTSCRVTLVSYDADIDKSIQTVNSMLIKVLTTLESNIENGKNDDNAYSKFEATYIDIKAEVTTARLRSESISKYKEVAAQIIKLESSVKELEKMHRKGSLTQETLSINKSGLEVQLGAMLKAQQKLKKK